jgi:hypothetical protein
VLTNKNKYQCPHCCGFNTEPDEELSGSYYCKDCDSCWFEDGKEWFCITDSGNIVD